MDTFIVSQVPFGNMAKNVNEICLLEEGFPKEQ